MSNPLINYFYPVDLENSSIARSLDLKDDSESTSYAFYITQMFSLASTGTLLLAPIPAGRITMMATAFFGLTTVISAVGRKLFQDRSQSIQTFVDQAFAGNEWMIALYFNANKSNKDEKIDAEKKDIFLKELIGLSSKDAQIKAIRCSAPDLVDEDLKLLATIVPDLEILELKGCIKITDAGISTIVEDCAFLRSLVLHGCSSLKSLKPILKKCQKLQRLDISDCQSIQMSSELINQKMTSLLILEIDNCPKLNTPEFQKWLSLHPKLKTSFSPKLSKNYSEQKWTGIDINGI